MEVRACRRRSVTLASVHKRELMGCRRILIPMSLRRRLLLALFNSSIMVGDRNRVGRSHNRCRRPGLRLQRNRIFMEDIPYVQCRHQAAFLRRIRPLRLARMICLRIRRCTCRSRHRRLPLWRWTKGQFLSLRPERYK